MKNYPRDGVDWAIFNDTEIQRCDDSPVFASDADAAAFVVMSATDDTAPEQIREECRAAIRALVLTWEA